MHWADVIADKLAANGSKHRIAAGITPSGEFHIGHLREILTGDIIARACRAKGLDAELVFIVDSSDPLRRVYKFLDEEYEEYIGHRLSLIPPPDQDGKPDYKAFQAGRTYATHFLEPFLEAINQIGVKLTIIDNFTSYKNGDFYPYAKMVCQEPEKIRDIIETISGRELSKDWFPWSPVDSKGSLDGVVVTGYEDPFVFWKDSHGVEGKSDISKGEGKLPWRIDWPARWGFNNISCEPFGKDHGTKGGSYSTGKVLAEFFGHEAPQPLTYEWIMLKGQGAMSSSSGNTIGPIEALDLVPPEILRFLIADTKPAKAIDFNAGMELVKLADSYERQAARDFGQELSVEGLSRRQLVSIEDAQQALKYSVVNEGESYQNAYVTFRHLSMLAQIKSSDEDIWSSLASSGSKVEISETLKDRLRRIRNWIQSHHFPDEMRIEILSSVPELVKSFDEQEKQVLENLIHLLKSADWQKDSINAAIPSSAKNLELSPKIAYRVAYICLMGVERGPRLAPILEQMDKEDIINQLSNCLSS